MLVYNKLGFKDYHADPVPINQRRAWEFTTSLSGGIAPVFVEGPLPLRERVLWVFPSGTPYGWTGAGPVERWVFQFHTVPAELEQLLPQRGYYQVPLTDTDCDRLRTLAEYADLMNTKPTELVQLQTRALVGELSLIALREASPKPLSSKSIAHRKTEAALAWYAGHITEAPGIREAAEAVFVSPAHLRRLFHQARGESPHQALNLIRMEMAAEILAREDLSLEAVAPMVGLSSASALSRAFKAHYGISPSRYRSGKR